MNSSTAITIEPKVVNMEAHMLHGTAGSQKPGTDSSCAQPGQHPEETGHAQHDLRGIGSANDGVATVDEENFLSRLDTGKDAASLQRDYNDDDDDNDLVLMPSGRRNRHAVPISVTTRNAMMTTTQLPPHLETRRETLQEFEALGPVATHVEDVELDDADSVACRVDVAVGSTKSGPSKWTTMTKAAMKRKSMSQGKSGRESRGRQEEGDTRGPARARRLSLWAGWREDTVFGEKIVQPVADDVQNTKGRSKRKATRSLSDTIVEAAQEAAHFINRKFRRRDSGDTRKLLESRRRSQVEQNRAKNWPYQRPYSGSREEDFATGSSNSLASPHYSFVTVQDDMHGDEPSSREWADAVEELEPLDPCRSAPRGEATTMSKRNGVAVPSIQPAHMSLTPGIIVAQTQEELARVMMAIVDRVNSQADDGRFASSIIEQRFERIHQDIRCDVEYQWSAAREYLAEVAAERREWARDVEASMKRSERERWHDFD